MTLVTSQAWGLDGEGWETQQNPKPHDTGPSDLRWRETCKQIYAAIPIKAPAH